MTLGKLQEFCSKITVKLPMVKFPKKYSKNSVKILSKMQSLGKNPKKKIANLDFIRVGGLLR